MEFTPVNPDYAAFIHEMCAAQPFMQMIGGVVSDVSAGKTELQIECRKELTQHSGVVHAGVTTTLADNACGCAATTLYPAGYYALTTEFKINFVAPAMGERLIARGRVIKAGKRLSTCAADVVAVQEGREVLVATMLASIFRGGEAAS